MFDEFQERLNKSALLLVNERYLKQLAPWVKDSSVRLAYVHKDIERILIEVADETGADLDYLRPRFFARLDERMADKQEPLVIKDRSDNDKAGLEDIHHDDVTDKGEVEGAGLEEALNDGVKKVDLKNASTWPSCFRCSSTLNPVWAAVSPVCKTCTDELKSTSGWTVEAIGEGRDFDSTSEETEPKKPRNPEKSQLFTCSICKDSGQAVHGTHDEMVAHVEDVHQDLLKKQREGEPVAAKVADVPADTTEQAVSPPPEEGPADRFDDIVQDLADRAAAQQFSMPRDEVVNQIASQYQVDAHQVRDSLYATATFGKYTGVNGHIDTDGNTVAPDDYTEVQMPQSDAGRVGAHEAIVPVDVVVSKVADEMGMDKNLVYSMVRDKYGADLPDKYHASVSGEHHFYLPTSLVGNAQPMPDQTQPQQQPAPDPNAQAVPAGM